MTALSEFRDTYSWQGAIDLGPHLARLADELPAAEDHGLAPQLRKGMVELPAAIAADILQSSGKDQKTRLQPMLQLLATIDVIDRVYPALDTAAAREALENLFGRLLGPSFDDHKSGSRPTAAQPEPETPVPHPAEPSHPAPETVPIIPEAATPAPSHPAVDPETNPALKVAVSPDTSSAHQES